MAIFCREYAKGRSAAEILREQGIYPKIFGENRMSSLRTFYGKVKASFPGKEQLALEGKDKNAKNAHNYKRKKICQKPKTKNTPKNRGKSYFHLEFFLTWKLGADCRA